MGESKERAPFLESPEGTISADNLKISQSDFEFLTSRIVTEYLLFYIYLYIYSISTTNTQWGFVVAAIRV